MIGWRSTIPSLRLWIIPLHAQQRPRSNVSKSCDFHYQQDWPILSFAGPSQCRSYMHNKAGLCWESNPGPRRSGSRARDKGNESSGGNLCARGATA
jgi:hypothetical protein